MHATVPAVGAAPNEILVCQTGLIGIPFPLEAVRPPRAPDRRRPRRGPGRRGGGGPRHHDHRHRAKKVARARGNGFTVGAMAKGAAMLAPNMATMLALCTTDAVVDPKRCRPRCVPRSTCRSTP